MGNSHGVPDTMYEIQGLSNDLLPACIVSTTFPAVPAPPSLTLAAFATAGYVQDGPTLVYVTQEAHTVVLTGADGQYWLALGQDTWTTVASWNRTAGTHYLWRQSATQPPTVDGILPFVQLTVSGGAITAVTPLTSVTSQPLSKQLSGAAAVIGGTVQNVTVGAGGGISAPHVLSANGSTYLLGTVGIQTPAASNGALSLKWARSAQYGLQFAPTDSDSGFAALAFHNLATGQVGTIQTSATATAYNTSSDVRLKESIAALLGALDVIRALRPVSFRWQADGSKGHGFLAHELMKTIPEAVSGLPDEVNPDGTIKPQQVDHSRLVVWLVGAVQELAARVQTLEAALA
jgi:Chaperone of endosialidase